MDIQQEALMKMLEDLMKQKGQTNIKIGNFIIRQDEDDSPDLKPRQQRNNTAVVVPTQYSSFPPQGVSKSEKNIEQLEKKDSLPFQEAPPNDFVQDIFGDLNEFNNLEQFIDVAMTNQSKIDSVSNKSMTVESLPKCKIQKQLLPKFYQVMEQQKIDISLKDEMESALQYDFEQMLKPHMSISESSNTHISYDTLTTMTDTTGSDPLRQFIMSLFPPQQSLQTSGKGQIDFVFLYSQPLIQMHVNGTKKIIQKLDITKEMNSIIDVFLQCKTALRFMAIPARMDLFGEVLDLNPLVLHYSGHGVYMEQNQQSYLLFEQNHGLAQLVSAQQIALNLQKLKRPILFVFVASCHSRLIGEVFHQAGAEHVICVHTKEQIMDEVCSYFARAFYHSLINGSKTVCQAFEVAKNQVKAEERFPFAEENKFTLLNKRDKHNCSTWMLKEGDFINLSAQSQFKHTLPQTVQNFLGRTHIMQELVEKILMHQLIQVKGVLGIGKSALIKEVSLYLAERRVFKDGVLFIQMNQCDSFDSVTSRFSSILMPNMALQSKVEIKQLVVTQLIQSLKQLDVMIVLDNCDTIYHSSDRDVFIDFVELILSNCSPHICMTCRCEILSTGKIVKVEGLGSEDSANLLFMSASREISQGEINDLLNNDQNSKPSIGKIATHPLFQILDGHPQGIILSAGLLETYTLKELYYQLNNKQLMDLPIMSRISEEEKRALKVSLNLSWTNLVERYEKAAIFFGMLGLLPCGVYNDELEWIWGSGWEKLANQLAKNSLLICTKKSQKTHYCLYHIIVKFAESKLDQKHYKVYHLNIISLLLKKVNHFYNVIGTQTGDQYQPIDEFLQIEQNIKSALFREFEELSEGEWEYEPTQRKRKNSDSDTKRKGKFKVFEEDEIDGFALPLTKENLEIMQKKYETTTNNSQKSLYSGGKLNSSMMSSFKQNSDEPVTDNPARTRKSITSRPFNVTISEEQSNSISEDEVPFAESKVFKSSRFEKQLEPVNEIIQQEVSQQDLDQQDMQQQQLQQQQNSNQKQDAIKYIKSQPNPNLKATIGPDSAKPIIKTAEVKKLKFMEEIREEEKPQLNKRQVIPKLKVRAKSHKKEETQPQKKKNYDDIKRDKVQKLILYYCSILMLNRRYNESLKFINWSYQYLYTDTLFIANVLKTKACVYYMQKEESKAKAAFKQAKELFIKRGCSLGVAGCEAGTGYIYLQQKEFQLAKICFENALQFYENLNHDFGKHFLNRWLSLVKNKISSLKNDRAKHIKEEKLLIENLKQELKKGLKVDNIFQKKHKGGVFILRWLGDTLSLFVEYAFLEDSKQKDILRCLKNSDQVPHMKKKKEKEYTDNNKPNSSSSSTTTIKKKPGKSKLDFNNLEKQLNEIAEEEYQNEDQNNPNIRFNTQQSEKDLKEKVQKQPSIKMRQAIMPCFKKQKKQQQ